MKKIAITGGIASGKSAVCKIIEDAGYYVIYTDKLNKELLNDAGYIKKLQTIFPEAVNCGVVNKSLIRSTILENDKKRFALNSLAHAEITLKVEKLINNFNGELIFCEIPLIVESNMVDFFDEIWCVVADFETKISRIMKRDAASKCDAEKIIATQKKDSELISISDRVIENNGDLNKLKEEISELICTMNK